MKINASGKSFFITATSSYAGKTVVIKALTESLQQLNFQSTAYKPVVFLRSQSSSLDETKLFKQISSVSIEHETYYSSLDPEQYLSTQKIDFNEISTTFFQLASSADITLVEDAQGWRVPISQERTFSSWAVKEKLPVILVVGIEKDCLNYAILTKEAIQNDGLELVGWVINRINPFHDNYMETVTLMKEHLGKPLLGEIPYLARLEQRDLTQYINISLLKAIVNN